MTYHHPGQPQLLEGPVEGFFLSLAAARRFSAADSDIVRLAKGWELLPAGFEELPVDLLGCCEVLPAGWLGCFFDELPAGLLGCFFVELLGLPEACFEVAPAGLLGCF